MRPRAWLQTRYLSFGFAAPVPRRPSLGRSVFARDLGFSAALFLVVIRLVDLVAPFALLPALDFAFFPTADLLAAPGLVTFPVVAGGWPCSFGTVLLTNLARLGD